MPPPKKQRQPKQQATSPSGSPGSTPRPDVSRDALIVGIFGASGTGKSSTIKRLLRAPAAAPVLIFDPGHEYAGTLDEVAFLESVPRPLCGVRPSFDDAVRLRQFDRFCAVSLRVARKVGGAVVIVDELQRVTQSGAAPRYWRELIETGRKFGVTVIAAAQRPAAVDKHFFSNATAIQTGRLNFADDCRTLANVLAVPVDEVAALTGTRFIARDMLTGATVRGDAYTGKTD